jgi:ATP/ADP translocase/HEAT repeat protein
MLKKLYKQIQKILNVNAAEWPRITVAWFMIFLTRFGFIIGWSILLATFLSRAGVKYLPYLFLFNAVLVMIGTFSFQKIIHKVRRETLITSSVIAAAALMLLSVQFLENQSPLFFLLIVLAESIFLAQVTILISLFTEDLFSPLESQRTFPIIESAETIGGICGGLTLTFFANSIPSYKFIILWAIAILLIVPIVLRFNTRTMDIPKIEQTKDTAKRRTIMQKWAEIEKTPFLKGLALVVVLHWGIINIIEFQYTTAIQQEVFQVQQESLILAQEGYSDAQLAIYQQELASKLGSLHVIFNSIALIIQLVVASRVLTKFGVISTMLIHPVVTLLNLVGMTLRFDFLSAAITRGGYELTSLMFKNAYDSSYYAIPHSRRDEVKELLQGILKPLGAIFGTFLIMMVALNLNGVDQSFTLNLILVAMGILMTYLVFNLNRSYTSMSEQNISRKVDLPTRLNAIEILGQKGHKAIPNSLQKIIRRDTEPQSIKKAILKTLGEHGDSESIGVILEMLDNQDMAIRQMAAKCLKNICQKKCQKKKIKAFTRYRIIEKLESKLQSETEHLVREELIKIFFYLSPDQLTAFIMKSIKEESIYSKEFIRSLSLFEDSNLKHYLEPFLNGKDIHMRASAIEALWQFKELKSQLKHLLKQMLESKKMTYRVLGIQSIGRLQIKSFKKQIETHLKDKNELVHQACILSLVQLETHHIIPKLVERMLHPDHEWFKESMKVLKQIPEKFVDFVEHELHSGIYKKISELHKENKCIENMEMSTLTYLQQLYKKLHAHQQVHQIQLLLDSKCRQAL